MDAVMRVLHAVPMQDKFSVRNAGSDRTAIAMVQDVLRAEGGAWEVGQVDPSGNRLISFRTIVQRCNLRDVYVTYEPASYNQAEHTAPHTEVESDGSRIAFNPTASDRLAFVSMRIGEAFAHGTNGDLQKCLASIQDAARYLREAACDKGTSS